jgi:hypothetical protein
LPEEYQISRRAGRCTACSRDFARGEEHYSALVAEPPPVKQPGEEKPPAAQPAPAGEAPGAPSPASLPYRRLDFCASCWKPDVAGEFFSFWKTAVPDEDPDKDKPLARRLDTETVYEMFRRLEGQPDPEKQKFRFILALILMRKKRLRFTGVAKGPQGEHLVLEDRAENVAHKVLDPGLAEEEIDSLKGAVDRLLRGGGPEEDDPAR